MAPKNEPRTQVAGFRLTAGELAELDALLARLGFTERSDGLRALTLAAVASAHYLLPDLPEAA